MSAHLRVKNWKKFQHYKHRNPPWIRLYCDLDRDEDFMELTDTQKWWLVACWQDASKDKTMTGLISANEKLFKRRWDINSKTSVFEPLIERGFLVRVHDDSETPAECGQDAIPEYRVQSTDTEERQRQNGLSASVCVSAWNDMAEQTGLAKCQTMGTKRTKHFNARRKEPYFCEHILEAIQAVPKLGKFYLGGGDGDWRIHFDFLLQPDRVAQIIEKTEAPTSRPPEPGVFVRPDNFDIGDDDG